MPLKPLNFSLFETEWTVISCFCLLAHKLNKQIWAWAFHQMLGRVKAWAFSDCLFFKHTSFLNYTVEKASSSPHWTGDLLLMAGSNIHAWNRIPPLPSWLNFTHCIIKDNNFIAMLSRCRKCSNRYPCSVQALMSEWCFKVIYILPLLTLRAALSIYSLLDLLFSWCALLWSIF